MATDCLFCRIVVGEIPAAKLHEDDLVIAFRDVAPHAPTHVLVIPVEHLTSVAELADEHGPMLARLFSVAAEIARQEGIAESGFRLVANTGPDAGQSVHHLHVHLLGGRPLSWPPG